MPKGILVTHVGTAQVFRERVGIPNPPKEKKVLPPEPTPTPEPETPNEN